MLQSLKKNGNGEMRRHFRIHTGILPSGRAHERLTLDSQLTSRLMMSFAVEAHVSHVPHLLLAAQSLSVSFFILISVRHDKY